MSATHTAAPNGGAPHGEDGINIGKIVAVGVVSLVIFALSAAAAWVILEIDERRLTETHGLAPRGAAIGQAEIGIVDVAHFDGDRRLEEWRAAKKKRLAGYGWSDRSKGIIHIPVDKAIDELVGGAAAGWGADKAAVPPAPEPLPPALAPGASVKQP